MTSASVQQKVLRDAVVAGLAAALGGWALFIVALDMERSHLLLALAVGTLATLALEYMREIMHAGEAELEHYWFLPAGMGIVALVVVCELFVKAFAHLPEVGLKGVHTALSGALSDSVTQFPWWVYFGGLLGAWIYMAIATSRSLAWAATEETKETEHDIRAAIGRGLWQGLNAALDGAGALLIFLVAWRLFLLLFSYEEYTGSVAKYLGSFENIRLYFPFFWALELWHWLLSILDGWLPERWQHWRIVPASAVLLALLIGALELPQRRREIDWSEAWNTITDTPFSTWANLALMVLVVGGPLLLGKWWVLLLAFVLAAVIWLVPCLLMGAVFPFVRPTGTRQGFWLSIALAMSALIWFVIGLYQDDRLKLVTGGALAVGFGGLAAWSYRKEDWLKPSLLPVVPVLVALLVIPPLVAWQTATKNLTENLNELISASAAEETAAEDWKSAWPDSFTKEVFTPQQYAGFKALKKDLRQARLAESAEVLKERAAGWMKPSHLLDQDPPESEAHSDPPEESKPLPLRLDDDHDESNEHDQPGGHSQKHGHDHGPKFFVGLQVAHDASLALQELKDFRVELADREATVAKEPVFPPTPNMLEKAQERHQVLVESLTAVDRLIAQSEQPVKELKELEKFLFHRLTLLLEQCVSASLGFWATLLLLGALRRKEGPHPHGTSGHAFAQPASDG